jgi:hypothetical protein
MILIGGTLSLTGPLAPAARTSMTAVRATKSLDN